MSYVQSKLLLLSLLTVPLCCRLAFAAPVPDLYVAQVPATALSGPALEEAFARALDEVLVKVTGQRTLPADSARRRAVGPAGPLVRQYQPAAGGKLIVRFDPAALRRRLDSTNLPVWADDRPLTLVILSGDALSEPVAQPDAGVRPAPASSAGQLLTDTAARRGIPVVLARKPGTDEQGAEDPLLDPQATARTAGADLLLVGRRAPTGGSAAFRWTLVQGDDRAEWQGDGAAGADGLADRLAARYAISAADGTVLRVWIDGVDTFDAYGRLQSYLRSLDLIQSADLQRVTGGALLFELALRGNVNQLDDAFALQRILEPKAATGAGEPVYRLVPSTGPDTAPKTLPDPAARPLEAP